jgi:hypothetical protein
MRPKPVSIRPFLLVLLLAASLVPLASAGGHWETWTVEDKSQAPNGDGLYTSIVVGKNNITHVSWINPSTWEVKYGRFENNEWSVEIVGPTASSGYFSYTTSIDLDHDGNPSISYTNPDGHLIFAHRTKAGTWFREDIGGDAEYKIQLSSLKYDPDGYPAVAYTKRKGAAFVPGPTELDLTRKMSAGNWMPMVVAGGGSADTGYAPSLGYTKGGKWWIAFRTGERRDPGLLHVPPRLVIAREQDTNGWWDILDDHWYFSGVHPSLAVDSAGGARIIHTVYHIDKKRVELAYESVSRSSPWTTSHEEVVYKYDTTQTWEDDPWKALALDSSDTPHISYYDKETAHLMYATKDKTTGSWAHSTVDDTGTVGRCNAIALDPAGNPWISYQDLSKSAVKVARWVPA